MGIMFSVIVCRHWLDAMMSWWRAAVQDKYFIFCSCLTSVRWHRKHCNLSLKLFYASFVSLLWKKASLTISDSQCQHELHLNVKHAGTWILLLVLLSFFCSGTSFSAVFSFEFSMVASSYFKTCLVCTFLNHVWL